MKCSLSPASAPKANDRALPTCMAKEIEKFIIRQPSIGGKDDYDSKGSRRLLRDRKVYFKTTTNRGKR